MHPMTLLFVLLGTVPLVVAGAGVVAFFLMRAGYGVLVWAVVPFVGSLLVVATLAFLLSRSARSARAQNGRGSPGGRRRDQDGV